MERTLRVRWVKMSQPLRGSGSRINADFTPTHADIFRVSQRPGKRQSAPRVSGGEMKVVPRDLSSFSRILCECLGITSGFYLYRHFDNERKVAYHVAIGSFYAH